MNIENLEILEVEDSETNVEEINNIEQKINKIIPDVYKQFLLLTNGAVMNECVLYSLQRIVLADEIHKPGNKYVCIGNDNGDYEIIMEAKREAVLCGFIEAGSIGILQPDKWLKFEEWINKGCPVDDESELELLNELLYEKSTKELADYIKQTEDSRLLHLIAGNYNWDDGFDVPLSIVNNKFCDLGTALMIFSDADGYAMLFDDEPDVCNLKKWTKFVSYLKEKIENNEFTHKNIKFVPSLTRVMKFKIKKYNLNINKIFIDGIDGQEVEKIVV